VLKTEGDAEDYHAGMAQAPCWCPPGLTSSQRRRIQWMRAQKMREEAIEKERDEHFNNIRLVILTKQEWRVKEKANTPAPKTLNDGMDLLDDDEAPLIKDGSPPPTNIDSELVKTNLTLNSVGGNPIEARGVISMEVTIGNKSLATAFFVVEV
jgi:hypothetical protein